MQRLGVLDLLIQHTVTEKHKVMLQINAHLKLINIAIVLEAFKRNLVTWTYLAGITLMKHFEHIYGALVPLQSHIIAKLTRKENQRWSKLLLMNQNPPCLTSVGLSSRSLI